MLLSDMMFCSTDSRESIEWFLRKGLKSTVFDLKEENWYMLQIKVLLQTLTITNYTLTISRSSKENFVERRFLNRLQRG